MSEFKVIICGGRDFDNYNLLKEKCSYFLSLKNNVVIISGRAIGADRLGEKFAMENGYKIKYFPAKWDEYGKSAGFIRNEEMLEVADAVIAFWDGKSKGTRHMIDITKSKGIPLKVIKY